jgi:hypothetical protein
VLATSARRGNNTLWLVAILDVLQGFPHPQHLVPDHSDVELSPHKLEMACHPCRAPFCVCRPLPPLSFAFYSLTVMALYWKRTTIPAGHAWISSPWVSVKSCKPTPASPRSSSWSTDSVSFCSAQCGETHARRSTHTLAAGVFHSIELKVADRQLSNLLVMPDQLVRHMQLGVWTQTLCSRWRGALCPRAVCMLSCRACGGGTQEPTC